MFIRNEGVLRLFHFIINIINISFLRSFIAEPDFIKYIGLEMSDHFRHTTIMLFSNSK